MCERMYIASEATSTPTIHGRCKTISTHTTGVGVGAHSPHCTDAMSATPPGGALTPTDRTVRTGLQFFLSGTRPAQGS